MGFQEHFRTFSQLSRYSNQGDRRILENIDKYIQEQGTNMPVEDLEEYLHQSQGDKQRIKNLIIEFYEYYTRKTGIEVETRIRELTPIDQPFERRMKIAEYLHTLHSRQEIQDQFCVRESTLRNDLKALVEGIEVFGSKIQIEECENRRNHSNRYYICNVFPVFLPLNLSEVYLLTAQLLHETDGTYFAEQYKELAQRIFGQLSEYGKEKIKKTSGEIALEGIQNDFRDERERLQYAENRLGLKDTVLYALKGGHECRLVFREGNNSIGCDKALVLDGSDGKYIVRADGRDISVDLDQIEYCYIEKYL